MKIKAKCSFAGSEFSASSGQVLDLPDDIAKDLIAAEFAEDAKDEDKRNNARDGDKPAPRKRSSAK